MRRVFDALGKPMTTTASMSDAIREAYVDRYMMADTSSSIGFYTSTDANGSDWVYQPYTPREIYRPEDEPIIWECEACGTKHNIRNIKESALTCSQCGHPLREIEEEDEMQDEYDEIVDDWKSDGDSESLVTRILNWLKGDD